MSMFCYQCQEAAGGKGCSIQGVCGKTDDVANLQDLLIHVLKGVAIFRKEVSKDLREKYAKECEKTDRVILTGLFSTITNANFDKDAFYKLILEAIATRDLIKSKLAEFGVTDIKFADNDAATWTGKTLAEMEEKAKTVGVMRTENEDIRSLRELLIYGVKGMAAYAEHAMNLGYTNNELVIFAEKALVASIDDSLTVDELVALVLECGKNGVDVMALLDEANTATFGNPEITEVNLGVGTRPGILVSGHDLNDMLQLLEQSKDSGVDIYTHSEMLPTHYYPRLKKYSHLVGNYGNAWWKQKKNSNHLTVLYYSLLTV